MEILELEKNILEESDAEAVLEEKDWISEEVLVIILKTNSLPCFENSYNLEICGKKMLDWVSLATSGPKHKYISYAEGEDVLVKVRPYLGRQKYTAIFYSDTPLLKHSSFVEIMEYFRRKDMNVLKLLRGYVFLTSFLEQADEIFQAANTDFDDDIFYQVKDAVSFNFVTENLHDRIVDFHVSNGVLICDKKSTFIGADVEIEAGTIIYPNNIISGTSYIGSGCTLFCGNEIINSIVLNGCQVTSSFIKEHKIEENSIVGPFERLL